MQQLIEVSDPDSLDIYLGEAIRHELGDDMAFKCHDCGDDGWVLLNDRLAVKAPKNEGYIERFEREITVLTHLNDCGIKEIPSLRHVGEKTYFLAMDAASGVQMSDIDISNLSSQAKASIGQDLGKLLAKFHGSFTDDNFDLDSMPDFQMLPEVSAAEETLFSPAVQQCLSVNGLEDYCRAVLSNYRFLNLDRLVLGHGDMRDEHVFIDPETYRLTNVIDLGRVGLRQPEMDFLVLLDSFGDDITRNAVKSYNAETDENLSIEAVKTMGVAYFLRCIDHSLTENNDPAEAAEYVGRLQLIQASFLSVPRYGTPSPHI